MINNTYKAAEITFAWTQWNTLACLTNLGYITPFNCMKVHAMGLCDLNL